MDKDKRNCAFFMKGGYSKCKIPCRNLHPITFGEGWGNVPTIFSGVVKRDTVCKFFNQGDCRSGANCRFCHVICGDPNGGKRKFESEADKISGLSNSFIGPSTRTI
eukprot:Em0034g26a